MQARLNARMPRPLDTLAARLKHARTRRGITQETLAELSGMKQPDVSKIERGAILQTTGISRLAYALEVDPRWLETGQHPEPDFLIEPYKGSEDSLQTRKGQAHAVSDILPRVDLKIIDWEDVLTTDHERFSLRIRDDSMEPLLNPGDLAHFLRVAADTVVAPGKHVLVIDGDENLYVREFKLRRPGHWQGMPLNMRGYDPLDSVEDSLQIVALLTGVDWA